jgi:hypothetical protein
MKTFFLMFGLVGIGLMGCRHASGPEKRPLVWTCGLPEEHMPTSDSGFRFEPVSEEDAMARLIRGESPDAVLLGEDASLDPVRYFFESLPDNNPNETPLRVLLGRFLSATERSKMRRRIKRHLGLEWWTAETHREEQHRKNQALIQALESTRIDKVLFQQATLVDVIRWMNQHMNDRNRVKVPKVIFRASDELNRTGYWIRKRTTLEMRDVSMLDLLRVCTEIMNASYVIEDGKVVVHAVHPPPVTRFYRVDRRKLFDLMPRKESGGDSKHRPATIIEDPFLPRMGEENKGVNEFGLVQLLDAYGVKVYEAGYEPAINALMVKLEADQIPQLESVLYRFHRGTDR